MLLFPLETRFNIRQNWVRTILMPGAPSRITRTNARRPWIPPYIPWPHGNRWKKDMDVSCKMADGVQLSPKKIRDSDRHTSVYFPWGFMGKPWFSMAHFPWTSPANQSHLAGGPDRHRPRGDPANSPEDTEIAVVIWCEKVRTSWY